MSCSESSPKIFLLILRRVFKFAKTAICNRRYNFVQNPYRQTKLHLVHVKNYQIQIRKYCLYNLLLFIYIYVHVCVCMCIMSDINVSHDVKLYI